MQSDNPFFDELARLMTGAAGAAQGVRREVENLFQAQTERMASELGLIRREEFEALKAMSVAMRTHIDTLEARLNALEGAQPASESGTPASGRAVDENR